MEHDEFATRSSSAFRDHGDMYLFKTILVANMRSGYEEYWSVHHEVPLKIGFEI